jgi:hypothetical protein
MPTIPLYSPATRPLGSHNVISPGGYEWWQFQAADAGGERGVEIDIFHGNPFDASYLAAYARYRRRPTRNPPPQPAQYPFVRLRLCRRRRPTVTLDAKRLPTGFSPNELLQPDESVRLSCLVTNLFTVSLQFKPKTTLSVRSSDSAVNLACDVEGSVTLSDGEQIAELSGEGRIIQTFGTEPIRWKGSSASRVA